MMTSVVQGLTSRSFDLQQGSKRVPGTSVTKSVVANEPGGRKREEVFVDIIEKISVTFNAAVSPPSTSFRLFLYCISYSTFRYFMG